jgi:uncharacterized protein
MGLALPRARSSFGRDALFDKFPAWPEAADCGSEKVREFIGYSCYSRHVLGPLSSTHGGKMRNLISVFIALVIAGLSFSSGAPNASVRADYPVQVVPLTDVEISDQFWAPKQEVNRTVSIQHCIQQAEQRGGTTIGGGILEGAGYMITKRRDPAFEEYIKKRVDATVARSAAAAGSAGQSMRGGGPSPEAAVAYFGGTQDRRLLDLALKAADAADAVYGPGKKGYISGHEGQKIGLIRLFRFTGDEKYWKLAQFFLDIRGQAEYRQQSSGEYPGELEYNQNHKPVLEQNEAVGHCVRATYLYIPLTDIAALTGRPDYLKADDALWQDVVARKMYITGGIGAIRQQEKFGAPYQLPNVSSWHETCASYGNVVWNHRLFLLHKDAKYIDTMERILYNGFLAGVSLKGDRFFYQNVLMSYGNYERFDWINVPCCPPNVVRLMASIGSYIYAKTANEIYVNLFAGSRADLKLADNNVSITQETRYPWEGKVKVTVNPERTGNFALMVRIPEWARNTAQPGDLYRYLDASAEKPTLSVNGAPVALNLESGYARLDRTWKSGDIVELNLPMPVRKVLADERVQDDRGRVALQRGPLVYCAEWPDNGGSALNLVIPDKAALKGEFRPALLNGVTVITGQVQAVVRGTDGVSSKTVPHNLVAIPYYSWANRGMGEMTVWIARNAETARLKPALPGPVARIDSFAGIVKAWTGYGDQNDDICAVYDGVAPLNSADESHLYFRMRPPESKPAWIEYQFKAPTKVSSSKVYFADDSRFCRLPSSWRIVYQDGDAWKPVVNSQPYAVGKDRFNEVAFTPVTTTAVRIEVEPQSILYKGGAAGPPAAMRIDKDTIWREFGIIEWQVK